MNEREAGDDDYDKPTNEKRLFRKEESKIPLHILAIFIIMHSKKQTFLLLRTRPFTA